MRKVLTAISVLTVMLIAAPVLADGQKVKASSECLTLTITAPDNVKYIVYVGGGEHFSGDQAFTGLHGDDWSVSYKGKEVASGTFVNCGSPTTTTLPSGPAETIQVCRGGELIFIDPGDRLESDTDECDTTVAPTTTTIAPESTTTAGPETTTTYRSVGPEAQPEISFPPTTSAPPVESLPFTGIDPGLTVLAGLALLSLGGLLVRRSDG